MEVTLHNKILLSALFAAAGLLTTVASFATGNPEQGANKNRMCIGCHGIPGYRTAYPEVYGVPKIGGQHQDYIISALHSYRDKNRPNLTMQAIAAGLTDQDIEDLAAYYGAPRE
jgi:hypothetical protein